MFGGEGRVREGAEVKGGKRRSDLTFTDCLLLPFGRNQSQCVLVKD
jgi:hypothetical protein